MEYVYGEKLKFHTTPAPLQNEQNSELPSVHMFHQQMSLNHISALTWNSFIYAAKLNLTK